MMIFSNTATLVTLACTLGVAPPAEAPAKAPPAKASSSGASGPAEPAAPKGAEGGFDTNPATGERAAEVPQFAPVDASPAGQRGASSGGDGVREGADSAPVPPPSQPPIQPPGQPSSPPPDGARAFGQGEMAPLPPPPPPVDPASIAKGPWRGRGYLRLRVDVVGPVGGEQPSRANVVAAGGGAEVGWRINNWVEVGTGVEGHPHRRIKRTFESDGVVFRELADAGLTNWDFGVVRFFYPLEGRVQPFLDVGGGLAVLGSLPGEPRKVGGQGRASLGTDIWVSKNLSLELGLAYRLTALDGSLGHHLLGRFGLGIHW